MVVKSARVLYNAGEAAEAGLRVHGTLVSYRTNGGQLQGVIKIGAKSLYIDTVIWDLDDNDTDGSERP